MKDVLIKGSNICLSFAEQEILNNVSIEVSRGEIVTLIGPNGAGKSSLVRIVLKLLKPNAGSLTTAKHLRIGYMPQKLHVEASLPLTVERFLALASSDKNAIQEALSLTGTLKLRKSPLQKLSGGETQRILLARAILRAPNLLVLDEPVQGVDVAGQAQLYQLIVEIRDRLNCGVLMVSHDLHLVMAATDTVVCLNQHVCCHGHPSSVTEHPAYLEMFGQVAQPSIAVYTHHHDHSHDDHGNIVEGNTCSSTEHNQSCGVDHRA